MSGRFPDVRRIFSFAGPLSYLTRCSNFLLMVRPRVFWRLSIRVGIGLELSAQVLGYRDVLNIAHIACFSAPHGLENAA